MKRSVPSNELFIATEDRKSKGNFHESPLNPLKVESDPQVRKETSKERVIIDSRNNYPK